jgi:HEAT repeat protein
MPFLNFLRSVSGVRQAAVLVILGAPVFWTQIIKAAQDVDAIAEIPGLIAKLRQSDRESRLSAIGQLRNIRADAIDAIPDLLKICKSEDKELRLEAAYAVMRIDPSNASVALPVLFEGLKDPDEDTRWSVCRDFEEFTEEATRQAIPELIGRLLDNSKAVREPAANILETIGMDRTGVAMLIPLLSHSDEWVQTRAMELVGAAGPRGKEAVPLLEKHLKNDNPWTQLNAAAALVKILGQHQEGMAILSSALKSREWRIRTTAAVTLLQSDPHHAEALKVLAQGLSEQDPELRKKTVRRLGDIALKNENAAEYLAKALNDSDRDVVLRATDRLRDVGPKARLAVPGLLSSLRGEFTENVIDALGHIGPAAKAAVPELGKMMDSRDYVLSLGAASALLRIDPDGPQSEKGINVLIKGLRDDDGEARTEAVISILKIKHPGDALIPALVARLSSDENATVRRLCADALGQVNSRYEESAKGLVQAFQDTYPNVREKAALAIGAIEQQRGIAAKPLVRLLDDQFVIVRFAALDSLARLQVDPPIAVPAFKKCLKDPSCRIRKLAAESLGKMGPPAKDAVEALKAALDDKDKRVSSAAREALSKIQNSKE